MAWACPTALCPQMEMTFVHLWWQDLRLEHLQEGLSYKESVWASCTATPTWQTPAPRGGYSQTLRNAQLGGLRVTRWHQLDALAS